MVQVCHRRCECLPSSLPIMELAQDLVICGAAGLAVRGLTNAWLAAPGYRGGQREVSPV